MDCYSFGGRKKGEVYLLVSYDISSNKMRLKLTKLLERYGTRVQLSAFELWLNPPKYREFMRKMKTFQGLDNIRIYQLPGEDCVKLLGEEQEKKPRIADCDMAII